MPNVQRLLTDEGVSFSHYYISVSLCCPSRTTLLRGQYSHNTGVLSNGSGNGGFETAHRLGIENSTIGTWLQQTGYRTAYIGKYLNAYPDSVSNTYVPPGWDEFDSASIGDPYTEYNYTLNENGHLVHFGSAPSDYGTDVYVNKAASFIKKSAGSPFFVYLNVYAPHQPAIPAPTDGQLFSHARGTPFADLQPPRRNRKARVAASAAPDECGHDRRGRPVVPRSPPIAPSRRPGCRHVDRHAAEHAPTREHLLRVQLRQRISSRPVPPAGG